MSRSSTLSDDDRRAIARVVERLAGCRRLLFITGAGLSADSGLPTYRGIGGLYDRDTTEDGVAIEDALSGAMLRRRPEICWKHIAHLEATCRGARANDGHRAIAALQDGFEVWVLTQNVDGFHRAAGSKRVIDIHGDIHDLRCTRCPWVRTVADYSALDVPPSCPDCSALVRPDVVLFGELLPQGKVEVLQRQLDRGFDMVLSVGTSSLFPYIVQPVLHARRRGVPTVEINPGRTEVSGWVDIRVCAGGAAALSAIVRGWRDGLAQA